ncbi:zinc ABC transporter substrate-binding protein [uncultured Sutterella sp.]|uniref:metal ABC transporter solute-binding protein, Zn/Mn family n=1 Tax=uncultured Sutterella sp. TaxID=286133 RepID=UPI0025F07828|nr:zinc ABC transporter substrate-binding protein [uncultured Sutterella sp.]
MQRRFILESAGAALGFATLPPLVRAAQSAAARAPAKRLRVAASFDALAEIVRAVGGGKVDVETLIPAGVEPHDFTPNVKTIRALARADLFVVNGLGMEPWAERAAAASGNPALRLVTASRGIDALRARGRHELEVGGTRPHADGRGLDPHVWLSLTGAATEAKNIADAMFAADPENGAAYRAGLLKFQMALRGLAQTYSARFAAARRRFFITGHAAFGYLAREFGLKERSVEGVYADGEPSPMQLAALTEILKKERVKTVFAEALASPAVSRTLAAEAGARVVPIYTMESPEEGLSFLERMQRNLEQIARSLEE